MKRLEDFLNEKVELKSFYGCADTPTYSTSTNSAGCTVTTTDFFTDKNGNGVWDANESGGKVTTVKCPKTVSAE
jgi:hypothetical protein